jgi:cytoskeleton protein RodZ
VAPPREAPRVEEPPTPGPPKAAAAEPPRSPLPRQGETAARPVKPPDIVPGVVAVQSQRALPGTRTLKLRFNGQSWVEIRERGGKLLLQRLNEAGTEAEVSGRPPFSIIVGNAPEVRLLYEDRPFPLEPHTKVAVARFTLE